MAGRDLYQEASCPCCCLLPFYFPQFLSNVFESLNLYVSYFEFNAGLYYAIKKAFLIWTGDDWSKQLGPFLRRVFLISLPIIYALDWKFNWSLPKAFLAISVAFLLLSTTIHPWYFLGLFALVTWQEKIAWHWFWLGACAMGTYLLYSDGRTGSLCILVGGDGCYCCCSFTGKNQESGCRPSSVFVQSLKCMILRISLPQRIARGQYSILVQEKVTWAGN